MSMTVEEAIAIIEDVTWNGCGRHYGKIPVAREMAIKALEEIQQYREYREIFESHFTEDALKLFSDKEEFSKWFERGKWHVLKCDELGREVEEYRAIGTVSEFRELKEKATAKKVVDKLMYLECPNCGDVGIEDCGYCPCCGQKLLWD